MTSQSRLRSRSRDGLLRLRRNTCRRSTRFSAWSLARERRRDRKRSKNLVSNPNIAPSSTTVQGEVIQIEAALSQGHFNGNARPFDETWAKARPHGA